MKKKTVKKMLSAALVGAMVLSLAACGSKGDSKDEGGDSKDGVTLEFQQWWGVELPDGALDDICKDFTHMRIPRLRSRQQEPWQM